MSSPPRPFPALTSHTLHPSEQSAQRGDQRVSPLASPPLTPAPLSLSASEREPAREPVREPVREPAREPVRELFEPAYALLDPEALDLSELEADDFEGPEDTGAEPFVFEPSSWEDDLLSEAELEELFVAPSDDPLPPLELNELFEEASVTASSQEPTLASPHPHGPNTLSPRSLAEHPIFHRQDTPPADFESPSPQRTVEFFSERAPLEPPLEAPLQEPVSSPAPDTLRERASSADPILSIGDQHAQTLDEPLSQPPSEVYARAPSPSPRPLTNVTRAEVTRAEISEPLPSQKIPSKTPTRAPKKTPIQVAMMGAQGGVGVSTLSANLAVTLARQGLNVVLVDLNPSGANLHTHLGLEPLILSPSELLRLPPEPTLERLSWEPEALKEGGLWLCRPSLALHNATPVEHRVRALQAVRAQREVSFDVMLLDLGHHQDAFSLSRFHEAALSMTVFKPTITSIERGHLLIRAALFQSLLGQGDDASIVARALLMADHVGQLNTPAALMTALERVNPEVAQVMKLRLLNFKPQLIMNQCRTHAERDLALDLCAVLQRKWRLEATPLGSIDYDESAQQWGRQRAQRPLTLEHAGRSSLCADLERLGKRLTRLLTQGVPS